MKNNYAIYLLLTLTALFWGGNAVAGRLGAIDWQPMTLTCLRWTLAALLVLPFSIKPVKKDWPVIRKNLLLLSLLGGIGLGGFTMLLYAALTKTTAVNASILQAFMPVIIFILNFAVLGLKVRSLQVLGLFVSIVGVFVTCTRGNPMGFFDDGVNSGDLIMLAACLVYAGYTFGLRWRPDIHWLSYMFVVCLGASLASAPFMLAELLRTPFVIPGAQGWAVIAYTVIFPTFVSQISYAKGVQEIGGNRAGLFINLVPIFGSLLAVLILQEAFKWYHATGLVLVVGGILLAERAAAPE